MSSKISERDEKKVGGPFGNYSHGSAGATLNALCEFGLPLTIVEDLTVCGMRRGTELRYCGSIFARFHWFEDLDYPLFDFSVSVKKEHRNYGQSCQSAVYDEMARTHKPLFKLTLNGVNKTPLLCIEQKWVTQKLNQFLEKLVILMSDEHSSVVVIYPGPAAWIFEFKTAHKADEFVRAINERFVYAENELVEHQKKFLK